MVLCMFVIMGTTECKYFESDVTLLNIRICGVGFLGKYNILCLIIVYELLCCTVMFCAVRCTYF